MVAEFPSPHIAESYLTQRSVNFAFSMPSRWTFTMRAANDFVTRHLEGCGITIDPFCGKSEIATYRNDLAMRGGLPAVRWLENLLATGIRADGVIFDPPYSPRQISECYKSVGLRCHKEDTQNAALYRKVRALLSEMLVDDGIALSFGWQSSGFGRGWEVEEILIIQHGGAHNDTFCVAQRKPRTLGETPDGEHR